MTTKSRSMARATSVVEHHQALSIAYCLLPRTLSLFLWPACFCCCCTLSIHEKFLAVVRKHIGQDEIYMSPSSVGGGGGHGPEGSNMVGKVCEVFKQMDVRGDGDVSWEDFSAVRYTTLSAYFPPISRTHGGIYRCCLGKKSTPRLQQLIL